MGMVAERPAGMQDASIKPVQVSEVEETRGLPPGSLVLAVGPLR